MTVARVARIRHRESCFWMRYKPVDKYYMKGAKGPVHFALYRPEQWGNFDPTQHTLTLKVTYGR